METILDSYASSRAKKLGGGVTCFRLPNLTIEVKNSIFFCGFHYDVYGSKKRNTT
jgi:hypothetical protein